MITRYSQLVMPQDANVVGTLFGGQMVSWMDIAAAKATHRFLKGTDAEVAVTRAIDSIEFTQPIYVGNWVNFKAEIIETGRSSIKIKVYAFKENHKADQILACTALFTMVSIKKLAKGSYQKVDHNKTI